MLLLLLAPLSHITGLAAADIDGPAKVIDGDTIVIHNTKIRLHGIDAPESAQVDEIMPWRYDEASDIVGASVPK
jgi:endonuclease YncB( thermonuclease family)